MALVGGLILATLLVASAAASPADTDQGQPAPAHLTIASEGARPPYNYLSGNTLEGFEIDLGRDLCRRMRISCTFVTQDWDDMILGLNARRYDAIMAAMEINDDRLAQIAFSTPYVRMPSAFLTTKDAGLTAASPDALAGKRIGLQQGGTHEAFVRKVYAQSDITRYRSLGDAILDLEVGRVDLVIGDKDEIVTFLETRQDAVCCRILADVPRYPAYFGEGIGIGLRKEDTALKKAFDRAIDESMADGTFDRIAAHYFRFPIMEPPGAGAR